MKIFPADVQMKRESFITLPWPKKLEMMSNLIRCLTSDDTYLRSFAYTDLYELTGQKFGSMEQMKHWPKGPQEIQSQYQKWWNGLLKNSNHPE